MDKARENAKIHFRHLEIVITSVCNLNCKYCGNAIPYVNDRQHFAIEDIKSEMKEIFRVVDSVDIFQPMGGEPLLHPDIGTVINEAMKYSSQFNEFRITTNGVAFPSTNVLDTIIKYKDRVTFKFCISDYGELSKNITRLKQYLTQNNIEYRVDNYSGSDQYYDGWVNLNLSQLPRPDSIAIETSDKCLVKAANFLSEYKGHLFFCTRAVALEWSGLVPINVNKSVNLFDGASTEEHRKQLIDLHSQFWYQCSYCDGMHEDSLRISGAEQI